MESKFTPEEKRKWALKKHIRDNTFTYISQIVLTVLFAYVLLKCSRAEAVVQGLLFAFVIAVGRVIWRIRGYYIEQK